MFFEHSVRGYTCLQGVMLVFDITNQKSFDNIANWIQDIEMVSLHSTYVFVCKNITYLMLGVSAIPFDIETVVTVHAF